MIAKIMLTNAGFALSKEFDYKIPENLEDKASVGMRVIVPFGKGNSTTEGILVRICEESKWDKLKEIKSFAGDEITCTEKQLKLCLWLTEKYLCSFSQAYKLIRPPRVGSKIRKWIGVINKPSDDYKMTDKETEIYKAVEENGAIEYSEIYEKLGGRGLKNGIDKLVKDGVLGLYENVKEVIGAKYVNKVKLNLTVDEGYELADALIQRRATTQANMILMLCDCGDMTTADLVNSVDGNYSSLNSLSSKEIVTIYKEQVVREAYDEDKYIRKKAYTPTEEQKPVIDYIENLLDNKSHEKILLRGVTGSGKTEVFLQAIEHCIKNGRQAIMLVPEISLTPQMVERFVSRFGNSVAVMHSGLSLGERYDQWYKIQHGEVSVAVGARSAIFAPFDNIGIIILDEEHEASYKSEIAPRYSTEEVAIKRGEDFGAPVLLASATPEVATYYKAKNGEYTLFEMNKRYNENKMPKARIVDMRSELLDYHNMSPISNRLREEIRINLEKGEKTVLFLNRRGYNTFVSCRECGEVVECKKCSIAMTYHKKTDKLVCHYCGYTIDNPKECPSCHSKYIKFFGTGTQRIEDELKNLFPDARVLRMDYDTTSGKGGHEAILNKFKNGEADILLGTQMVTKGLDFPDVTLVGVLAADTSLNIDDFRASEKCFSLITQVCGRAGRGDIEGRAIIQTYQPQNRTILFAKEQNYTEYYDNEIIFRKRMSYPPFCDIVYILVSGENEDEVSTEINNIGGILNDEKEKTKNIIEILGPAPAPIKMIKGRYRYRILLKIKERESIYPIFKGIYIAHEKNGIKNLLSIDINPNSMV